jgi:hypothetical protein
VPSAQNARGPQGIVWSVKGSAAANGELSKSAAMLPSNPVRNEATRIQSSIKLLLCTFAQHPVDPGREKKFPGITGQCCGCGRDRDRIMRQRTKFYEMATRGPNTIANLDRGGLSKAA